MESIPHGGNLAVYAIKIRIGKAQCAEKALIV